MIIFLLFNYAIMSYPEKPTFPDFVAGVKATMNADSVSPAVYELRDGPAEMDIRLHGGFATRLALATPEGVPVNVLYCGPDLSVPKLRASHPMMPVGQSKGPGGQHGPLRWVEHKVVKEGTTSLGECMVLLSARLPAEMPAVSRGFTIGASRARLGTALTNVWPDRGGATSLGEHLYFDMPEGTAADVRINGQTVDELFAPDAAKQIDDGIAQFWPSFPGQAEVVMPDERRFRLEVAAVPAGAVSISATARGGMLLWREPGKPFICLEPTLGYGIDGSNDNIIVGPRASMSFSTTITALAPKQ